MKFDPKKLNTLAVQMHGRPIGVINRLAGDRHLFAFEQDYIDDPDRPTLSLSFKGEIGGLVTATRPTGLRLPPFFSNLLPEGHLRDYLAKRADVKSQREFFLLAVLGADLPGGRKVFGLSERHARRLLGQWRGTQRYAPILRSDEEALSRVIITLASLYGRYGYRRITALLQMAGWLVGKDRV